ncbi:MFS transporter [Streptomyces formicae]|uniref:Tetracycline resistance protein n=1 Tax=Streptomyces formicae TaxID=1616117 RepID=A0A291Q1Z1_9ACTN|nr:MFS transporter [Streptomyces formicae]ATL25751.1 Tetracycline resistance protein [Streptomyces formicae]
MTVTAPRAGGAAPPDVLRRVMSVLVVSQTLGGAGMAAGITVGALLAEDLLGSTGLAGLPTALFTGGAAVGAAAIGRLSQRHGRRPGLALGHGAAALGSAGVVAGAAWQWAWLLLTSLFVYGAGTATGLLARYAGADIAPPERRGRATGTVLLATTLGAVVGPNLVGPTGALAHAWGIPRLAGPFLLAAVAYAAAGLVLWVWLRPDPLLLARATPEPGPEPEPGAEPESVPVPAPRSSAVARTARSDRPAPLPGLVTGATVMITAQLVMIAVMTMTPVHMTGHGHGTQAAGFVIALHVGAMFLPSPLSGLLVDRIGRLPVAASSGAVLLAACLVAALAPPTGMVGLSCALVLLGVGWNLALVSGTALITDAVPGERRASVQGLVDVGVALAGATGGMASGLVVAGGGYPLLAVAAGTLALAVIPLVALRGAARS